MPEIDYPVKLGRNVGLDGEIMANVGAAGIDLVLFDTAQTGGVRFRDWAEAALLKLLLARAAERGDLTTFKTSNDSASKIVAERNRLQHALRALVGAETVEDLQAMKLGLELSFLDVPDGEMAKMINAIDVLIETTSPDATSTVKPGP